MGQTLQLEPQFEIQRVHSYLLASGLREAKSAPAKHCDEIITKDIFCLLLNSDSEIRFRAGAVANLRMFTMNPLWSP